jgi:small subunit ribosomal protein S2
MTISLQELFDAGVHLGHQAQKWHPRMKPWIYCEQNGIHIFDLEKTSAQLVAAKERIAALKKAGKSVVVVATKKQAADIVPALADEVGVMYVVNRWPGGLITNWEQVRKSIKRMTEIEEGLKSDKYREYTKYERLLLEKQLNRLRRLFGGVKALKNKPDALFIIDAMKEKNAVHEALKENVEVIALIDSNTDPTGIAIPVPGNDDALSSIKLIIAGVLGASHEAVVKVEVEAEAAEPVVAPEVKPVAPPSEKVKESAEVEKAPAAPVKVAVAKTKPAATKTKKTKTAKKTKTTKKTTVKKTKVKKEA